METKIFKCRALEQSFLTRWRFSMLAGMRLKDFTDTHNQDTFCYWVERITIGLGSIKGHPSIKFGIYRRSNSDNLPRNYHNDEMYSWAKGLKADNREQAFALVKEMVIRTATAALEHRFEDIDAIPLNHLFKWKIAALYAKEQLLPIFKKHALINIAVSRGILVSPRPVFSQIYAQLFAQKPKEMNVYEFALELLRVYHHTDEKGYYILGSKYGGTRDMLQDMIEKEVVATGFGETENFSYLLGNHENDLERELKKITVDGRKLERSGVQALKHFLRLKPGDIVAIKSSGNPLGRKPSLKIVAYAMVVERDGKSYFTDNQLGQCINVEFLQTGLERIIPIGGYAQTIHHVTDEETIDTIFGIWVNERKANEQIGLKRRRRKAGGIRNTTSQQRKGSKAYVAHMRHNHIQKKFVDYLKAKHGENNVYAELDYADVTVIHQGVTTIYEIKPYALAEDCIRVGLGQLLSYAHFDKSGNPLKLRIVGPNPANKIEHRFISYLKKRLNHDFDYEPFNIP